jgi:hypothetical protein
VEIFLIKTFHSAGQEPETIRTIRQVLNMTTSDEDMTRLLHRTLEDLTMMDEEDFRSRRLPETEDLEDPPASFYETEAAG